MVLDDSLCRRDIAVLVVLFIGMGVCPPEENKTDESTPPSAMDDGDGTGLGSRVSASSRSR